MFKKTGGGGVHFEQSSLVNDTKKYLKYKKVAKNMGKGGGGWGTSYQIHNSFIQRYYFKYKTHWSFKCILEERI